MKTFLLLLSLALPLRAADCPQNIPVSDAGWYNAANFHDPENNNFITGHHAAGPAELRNFFVFDLPVLSGPVGGAQLRIYTFTTSTPHSTETYELHHVATPVETLVASEGPELTNVFNDLGDGALYAARVVTNSEVNTYITITLNADARAALDAASGQRFALGGRISSLAAEPGVDEKLFAFSSGVAPYVELTLTFAGTNAPFLFAQPPPLFITNSGVPVSLSVGACGAEPLHYRWFFNGTPLNQTNSTLTLGAPNSGSSGTYFCVVSNVFGAVTSTPTELVIGAAAPGIFNLPASQTVVAGFTATFSCIVNGQPYPALQWYFAGLEIPGATGQFYQIPNVQPFHSATLWLVASNIAGVVTGHTVLQVEPLQISGPSDIVAVSGEVAYLEAWANSSMPVTYQWRLGGTNLPGATGRVLTLTNVPPGITGPYQVVMANSYGARTSAVATVNAATYGAPDVGPPIISSPPRLGEDLLLRWNAQGARPLAFQWFFNGQPLAGATNSDLVLMNFSVGQSGNYSYAVTNVFGAATSLVVNLVPEASAPGLYTFPATRELFVGQAGGLRMFTLGTAAQWQWNRDGLAIPGATNPALLFTNVTLADAGAYQLVASNLVGTASHSMNLIVHPRRALDRWTWRNSLPQANDLRAVASGDGRLVAGGEGGSLVTSTNGADWISIALSNQSSVERVVFGNGRFVALATGGNDPVLLFHSTDGVNWQPHAAPWPDVAALDFVNGEFFLTSQGGSAPTRLARSLDAIEWTQQALPTLQLGTYFGSASLAHGNGRYVLARPQEVLISADAANWERYAAPMIPRRLTFGNGVFAACTSSGEVWTSPDGRAWFARNTGLFITSTNEANLRGLAAGPGQFIAVGVNGALLRSVNAGATWTAANATTTRDLRDVVFDGTQWLVAGNDGVLLTSPDGVTWTDRRAGRTRDLYGIIYTNGQFVAVGYEGTVLTSPDALTWTPRNSGTTRNLHGVTYAAGLYVAVGRNGTVITSPNAINWVTRPTPTTNYLERVRWGGGRFVIAATGGTILSSTNGVTWQQHANPAPADAELEGVAYGAGRFVIVGARFDFNAHSIMLVSSNGTDWTSTTVDVGKGLRGVHYDGQQFLAVGNDGVVIFSADGLGWSSPQFLEPGQNWRHATHALGHLVVVGNEGALASFDGLAWQTRASIVSQNLHDIVYGAGKFVAVGNAGAIVQSEFAAPHFSGARATNGLMKFNVTGGLAAEYRIESAAALGAWQTASIYTNDGAGQSFSLDGSSTQGFFRAVSP